jgi:membrane protein YqaA with SNARE-associated domain
MDMLREPLAWLLVVLVSLIGALTELAFYKLGQEGYERVASRFPQINPEQWERAHDLFEKRGSWILLLSGVPGLNVVLVTAAGALGVRVAEFILWATIGKALRNWLVLIAGAEVYRAVVA